MTRIDSYHLEMHKSNVGFIALDSMVETMKSNGMHSHQITNPIPGIKSILVDHNNQLVKIQGSAKILTDDYLKGISLNTFEPWIERINQMGIIDLNPQHVYENGVFHSLDTTHNVPMGTNWNIQNNWEYIQNSILVSKQNPRFEPHIYNSKTNKGIEFRGGQQTSKNRMIFYGKEIELNRPKNRDFFKACSNPMAVLNQSTNLLRVESNNTSHKDIKQRFGVNTMLVRDILNSTKMPTLDMLNKITIPGKANQLNLLFESHPNADIKEIAMIYGFENIIRNANYHVPTIKAFVKMYTTDAMFRWWWYGGKDSTMSIKELIHKTQEKDFGVSNQNNAVMEHIKNSILDDYTHLKTA
jgi:hypothetical protein